MHTYVATVAAAAADVDDDDCYGKLNGMKNEISIVRFYIDIFEMYALVLFCCYCNEYN